MNVIVVDEINVRWQMIALSLVRTIYIHNWTQHNKTQHNTTQHNRTTQHKRTQYNTSAFVNSHNKLCVRSKFCERECEWTYERTNDEQASERARDQCVCIGHKPETVSYFPLALCPPLTRPRSHKARTATVCLCRRHRLRHRWFHLSLLTRLSDWPNNTSLLVGLACLLNWIAWLAGS